MLEKTSPLIHSNVISITKSMHCKRTIDLAKCNFNIIYPLQVHAESPQSKVQWNIAIIVVDCCKHIKTCITTCKTCNIFFLNVKRDERLFVRGLFGRLSSRFCNEKMCRRKNLKEIGKVCFRESLRSVETENKKAINHYKAYLLYLGFYPTRAGSVIRVFPFTPNHFIMYNALPPYLLQYSHFFFGLRSDFPLQPIAIIFSSLSRHCFFTCF